MLFLLKENAGTMGFVSFGTEVVCLEAFQCVFGSVAAAQADLVMFPVGSRWFWRALFQLPNSLKLISVKSEKMSLVVNMVAS